MKRSVNSKTFSLGYKPLYPEGFFPHIRWWFSVQVGLKEHVWVLACSEYNDQECSPKIAAKHPSELVWLALHLLALSVPLLGREAIIFLRTRLLRLFGVLR